MSRADFEVVVHPCDEGGYVAEVRTVSGAHVWADPACHDNDNDAREEAEAWIAGELEAVTPSGGTVPDPWAIWRRAVDG